MRPARKEVFIELNLRHVFYIGRYVSGLGMCLCAIQVYFFSSGVLHGENSSSHPYFSLGAEEELSIDNEQLVLPRHLHSSIDASIVSDKRELASQSGSSTASGGSSTASGGSSTASGGSSTASGGSSTASGSSTAYHASCWGRGGAVHDVHALSETLAFCFFCFVACNLLSHANLALFTEAWRFPISVVMFLAGMLIGVFFLYRSKDDWYRSITGNSLQILTDGMQDTQYFDPHALLYVVLPPLLFESASSMSWHVLTKILPSALLLAVPGVMFNTFLTGFYVKGVIRIQSENYQENADGSPTWAASWLLSSILSATDPVAVVAALASLGAPAKLSALVEGESLLNDGSAVVLCYVFRDWVMDLPSWANQEDKDKLENDKACPGNSTNISYGCTFLYFIRVAAGGAALGFLAGFILYYWVKYARKMHSPTLELGIVLTFVYVTFYVAEALKCSGVLATVTLGFIMTLAVGSRLSPEAHHSHHVVLELIAYFCNQITFFAAGVISARFMWGDTPCSHTGWELRPWLELAGLYVFVHMTRTAVILTFWPLLKQWGYGINWKEAVIMVYGGLRGAVGLIMALIIEHNHYIDPLISQMIVFHASGIVLLTLCINGQTIDTLYKKLEIYPANLFREQHLKKVLLEVEEACQKQGIRKITKDWFFKDCCFDVILQCVPNFGYIKFDIAHSPVPDGIESVHRTFKRLQVPGLEFRKEREKEFNAKSYPQSSIKERFAASWQERSKLADDVFKELMNSQAEVAMKRDQSISVHAVLHALDYSTEKKKEDASTVVSGIYVSGFSLQNLANEEDAMTFDIEILDLKDVEIIVGFFADDIEVREVFPNDENPLLGMQENTLGFNCERGSLLLQGPGFDDGVELELKPLKPGSKVSINVERGERSTGNWEIEIRVDGEMAKRITMGPLVPDDEDDIHWGPFVPRQLYPAVEFRPKNLLNKKLSKTGTGNSSGPLTTSSSVFGHARSSVCATPTNILSSGKNMLDAMGHGLGFKSEEDDIDRIESRKFSGPAVCQAGYAKTQINFETHSISDLDSVREVFHVFFNMTQNHYEEMHHEGILGDVALHWLLQCTAEAVDAAGGEINAKSLDQYLDRDVLRARSTPSGLAKSIVKAVSRQKQTSTRSMEVLKTENLYEPILLEYVVLRERVMANSSFDLAPLSWKRLRSYAYQHTRARIEALWAFIEAHEHLLHSPVSHVVERFPQLVRCVHQVVLEAKKDLDNLELVSPGRFFYTKHLLALRKIMHNRLRKLQKFINDGSLSKTDGEKLKDCFLKRLTTIDFHSPSSLRLLKPDDPKLQMATNHPAFAWAKVELPQRRGFHRLGEAEMPAEPDASRSLGTQKFSPKRTNGENTPMRKKRQTAPSELNETPEARMKIPGELSPSVSESLRETAAEKFVPLTVMIPEEHTAEKKSNSIESVGSIEGSPKKDELPDPSAALQSFEEFPKEILKGVEEVPAESGQESATHTGWTPLSLEPQEQAEDTVKEEDLPNEC